MRVYFSGIGGTGLAPLANLALDAGYSVLGSDLAESPGTAELKQRGVEMRIGEQDGEFLRQQYEVAKIDFLVHSSALKSDHPELKVAKELGIQIGKRDALINLILQQEKLKLVAVAGTHGKTTTVAMIIWACHELNFPISYLAGTNLPWGPSGYFASNSEFLIYEADEYDRNFLCFRPWCAAITTEDYDHPDIYASKADYHAAFEQFRSQSQSVIEDSSPMPGLDLVGELRRRDASLAARVVKKITGRDWPEICQVLERFPGAGRRFECLGERIYSDYAHHPAEIKATLKMARELCNQKGYKGVVAVYQPHQNSRQHEIRHEYRDAFMDADLILWAPSYFVREDPNLAILTPEELIDELDNANLAQAVKLDEDLAKRINQLYQDGYLILLMTAGPADLWLREHIKTGAIKIETLR